LDTLSAPLTSFFSEIQGALNESLRNENRDIPGHVAHLPFHFDYIDATVSNALAFCYDGNAFIGVTMPLIDELWGVSAGLANSPAVAALLEAPATSEGREAILTVMFQTELIFLVLHEYAHHVHGHLSDSGSGSTLFDEISEGGQGKLEDQAFEMDADAYAVFLALTHMFAGSRLRQSAELLGYSNKAPGTQEELLFTVFVMGIGAFLYHLPPASVASSSEVYRRTHPLQALRMNWIMSAAATWCRQNRPALESFMNLERFQTIMTIVRKAISEVIGDKNWNEQTVFLQSEAGAKYFDQLKAHVKRHVGSS
jgi:hypothetical protein